MRDESVACRLCNKVTMATLGVAIALSATVVIVGVASPTLPVHCDGLLCNAWPIATAATYAFIATTVASALVCRRAQPAWPGATATQPAGNGCEERLVALSSALVTLVVVGLWALGVEMMLGLIVAYIATSIITALLLLTRRQLRPA